MEIIIKYGRKAYIILSLLLIGVGGSSCTNLNSFAIGELSDTPAKLTVTLSNGADDSSQRGDDAKNENTIVRVRVIVIGASGSYWDGKVTCNQTFTIENNNHTVEAQTRAGNSNIYVVTNETEQMAAALSWVQSSAQFDAVMLTFTPLATDVIAYNSLPMMAQLPSVVLSAQAQGNEVTAQLERLYAKVRITLKAGVSDDGADFDGKVTLKSVQLMSIPSYSYMGQGVEYQSEVMQNGTTINVSEVIVKEKSTTPIEIYAPEYIVANPKLHSYLIVKGVLTGLPSSFCIYSISLGDATKSQTPNYNITRNTIYNIVGTVKGYGSGDVDIDMTVSKWSSVDASQTVGVRVNKGSVSLSHDNISSDLMILGNDLTQVTLNSVLGFLTLRLNSTTGVITANVDAMHIEALMESMTTTTQEQQIDQIEVKYNGRLIPPLVKVSWKPAFIARFAKGYLCHPETAATLNTKPHIGNPSDVGVVFKWGSLIGLSLVNGQTQSPENITPYLSYVPAGYVVVPNTPFLSPSLVGSNPTTTDGDYNAPVEDISTASGDICRHSLGDKWRIPTRSEMAKLLPPTAAPELLTHKRENSDEWPLPLANIDRPSLKLNGYFIGKNANAGIVYDGAILGADPIVDQTLFMRSLGSRDAGGTLSRIYGSDREMTIWTSTIIPTAPESGNPSPFQGYLFIDNGAIISNMKLINIKPQYGFSIRCIRK